MTSESSREMARAWCDEWVGPLIGKDVERSLKKLLDRVRAEERERIITAVSEAFQRREPSTGKWLTQFGVAREAIRDAARTAAESKA